MQIAAGAVLCERYEAAELLGRGGMGEVWRCHDLERGQDVALKLVRAEVLDETTARLFHDEALATARLEHPAIPRVYDLLEQDDGLALVLELRRGAALSKLRWLPFEELREVCCRLLEALAYAHARGVLHLDIKPDNVLVERDPQAPRATLLDFGIARAWRNPDAGARARDVVLGTHAYMAPEQILDAGPSMGPWTDLYALGATLYRVLAGRSAFADQALTDRPFRRPPRLDAAPLGLPEELADLLEALLAPREGDRPSHAADVLHALRQIPPAPDHQPPPPRAAPSGAPTQVSEDEPTAAAPSRPTASTPSTPSASAPTVPGPAPAPSSPPRDQAPPTPGAYALFGLRDLPAVGRDAERRRAWSELTAARAAGEVRVIALAGPAGTGTSRLARDLLERAHEAGLAHTAQTAWSEGGAGNEGLRALLAHALGVGGVVGSDLTLALRAWADRFGGRDPRFVSDARMLLDPKQAALDADLPARVCAEAIHRLAQHRAAVIWLDDASWGREAAEALLLALRARGGPVAVVVTGADDDERVGDPDAVIELAPLGASDLRGLVRGLLEVDDHLAALVAQRADGNPLFASQLLAELVEDDALERAGGVYSLRSDRDPDALPRDLPALWDRRLVRLGIDRRRLGAVALTRPRPSVETVARLAMELGPELQAEVRRATRAGLLHLRRGAYHWAHGQLRAHLAASVEPADRPRLHLAAARALAPLAGREDAQAERAHHLWAGGEREAACDAMTEAIVASVNRADGRARLARATTLLRWAEEQHAPAHRGRALAELAFLAASEGDADRARAQIAEARAVSSAPWVRLRDAQVAAALGDEEAARAAAETALEAGDDEVEMHASGLLALGARRRRANDEAQARFRRAAEIARARGDGAVEAKALMHLANMAPTESLALFERALEAAMEVGARRGELAIRQVYADALYLVGRRSEAAEQMRAVGAQARALGLRQHLSIAEIQLACWSLREGDALRAAAHVAEASSAGAEAGSRVERCMTAALRASVAALRDQPEAAAAGLARLEAVRADYDEDELREVLALGRAAARGELANAFDAALEPR